ncbi:MAG: hypothetical protein K2P30_16000 [Lachnospiraceae bacterium]|nr:hypothetical protein [Lachnospiraceae bacterium]
MVENMITANIEELSELIEGLSEEDAREFVKKLVSENSQKVNLEIEFDYKKTAQALPES